MSIMMAAVRREYCSPHEIAIESINKPIPSADEVLVKVIATTINRTDCAILTGKPFLIMRLLLGIRRPRKMILGTDFAGEIIAIGKNVQSFKIGDKVFGFIDTGAESHAEYLTTTEENLFSIPDTIDYKQAAASLESANYAYAFIKRVHIQQGQSILINGATGGIGSALLQFVRQYDVNITATCNTKNIELIKSLGADKIYDYTQEDFTNYDDTYDFIFDAVGKSTFGKCKPLLKENGVYISSELGPYAQNLFLPLWTSLSNKKVVFPRPFSKQMSISYIRNLLETGKFKPILDRAYSMEDIADGYSYLLSGRKTGNVLLNCNVH